MSPGRRNFDQSKPNSKIFQDINYSKHKDNKVVSNAKQQKERFKMLMEHADFGWKHQISHLQHKLDKINRL